MVSVGHIVATIIIRRWVVSIIVCGRIDVVATSAVISSSIWDKGFLVVLLVIGRVLAVVDILLLSLKMNFN
jgi:hypothetical protein